MKFTDIKKKLLISSLAVAMAATSVSINRIHGESDLGSAKVTLKTVLKNSARDKKALLKKDGSVTGRTDADLSDNSNIQHLETITDLMVDADVTNIQANRFFNMTALTKLTFKDATTTKSKLTTIGKDAFKNTRITTVTFPKALTTIEGGAFADNPALTEIKFTNSKDLKFIKTGAFENCALVTVDLSPMDNGTTATQLMVEDRAFKGNKTLTSATLSTKMTELMPETFSLTGITTFDIIKEISTVSPFTFKGTALQTLTVNAANNSLSVEENVLYNKTKTKLVLYPEGKTDTTFIVKEAITHIESNAFNGVPNLTTITTGSGLINIGDYAFAGAKKLSEVVLNSDKLQQIGQYAFSGTAISSIALTGGIQGIEMNAFAGAEKLTKFDIRKATAIKTIKANAFKNTALNSMLISKTTGPLTTITAGAFDSKATTKQISFTDDKNDAITGTELSELMKKYKFLTEASNGSWTFDVKLPTPNASVDYDIMKLKGLEASATYTINNVQYTADAKGQIDLLKAWGGSTLTIIRLAVEGQSASEAQSLPIDKMYSVYVDGKENSVKKVGATVTLTAATKSGFVFTKWSTSDVALTNADKKEITFAMPNKDVQLTKNYTEIVIVTPAKDLLYNGKEEVKVVINSVSSNFSKLSVNNAELTKGTDYTMAGTSTTDITLKKVYLDSLNATTEFVVTFTEGGDKQFSVRLLGAAPVAKVDYTEMKLTHLVANAEYKINNVVKTADQNGKIDIEKAWSNQKLEIIKVATDVEIASKPQELKLETFYTITVNGEELSFVKAGTSIMVKAERKEGYKLKEWTATGLTLTAEEAKKEEIEFTMPSNDVHLKTTYTKIITTKPEDMEYDGTKEVEVRFDIPMNEFQYIEYNGEKLVKGQDYTVTTGSTIVKFTKSFLDKMKGNINGFNAVFTSGPVNFSIKLAAPVPPVVPNPPVVNPNPPVVPVPPVVKPTPPTNNVVPPVAPNKATVTKVIKKTGTPKTGDTTNIYLLGMLMMLCIGAIVLVKKKIKQ